MIDSLGRLIRVDEPKSDTGELDVSGVPYQSTNYGYDVLGNLLTVNQGVQTRTFVYDSLSRLKSATNPESGSINYSYDSNGNLLTKTDARNITTSYSYDALNRVVLRDYSDSTPDVSYFYDGTGLSQVPSNSKGVLTKVSSSVSETRYTGFDALGRLTSNQQITDRVTYPISYSYNLAGAMVSETYPSGRVVTNSFDSNGKLSNVSSKSNTNAARRTYANSFRYTAHGAVESMRLGNGKFESTQFNTRLQPTQIALGTSASSTSLLKLNYDYGTTDNNGNVKSQTITVAGMSHPLIQTYTYDSLNRLQSAEEKSNNISQWKQTFTFDRYGNRRFDTTNNNTTTLPSGYDPNVFNPTFNTANNRMSDNQGYEYDSAGNVTKDASNKRFIYDAENKQTSFGTNGSNTNGGTYSYDGDGKRIKKIVGSETTVFVYNASGQLVAEYTATAPQNPTISYLTSDTLGTPRINTDANGQVTARHDYMPFGEEIVGLGNRTSSNGYQDDDIRQKFTQKEWDNESGLDYFGARYYANAHGRFTSPDPLLTSGRPQMPQSWNRYVYTLNNPLKYIDPTGLYEYAAGTTDEQKKKFEAALQKANDQLAAIEKKYGKDSKEYTDAVRALNAYGNPNQANGVTVKFGALDKGTQGSTLGTLSSTGANTVNVTIDLKQNDSGNELLTTIAHEGSHVQDNLDYQSALLAASNVSVEAAEAVYNGPLHVTHGASETRAYGVSSVFAEFTLGGGVGDSPISGGGGTTTFKFDLPPVKSITVGGKAIWQSSWQKLDIEKIRANRSAAIAEGLKKDPRYAPNLNKRIQEFK